MVLDLPMNDIGKDFSWSRRDAADDRGRSLIAARFDPKDVQLGFSHRHVIGSMLMGLIRLRVGL